MPDLNNFINQQRQKYNQWAQSTKGVDNGNGWYSEGSNFGSTGDQAASYMSYLMTRTNADKLLTPQMRNYLMAKAPELGTKWAWEGPGGRLDSGGNAPVNGTFLNSITGWLNAPGSQFDANDQAEMNNYNKLMGVLKNNPDMLQYIPENELLDYIMLLQRNVLSPENFKVTQNYLKDMLTRRAALSPQDQGTFRDWWTQGLGSTGPGVASNFTKWW